MKYSLDEIHSILKTNLSEKRYAHSVRVAEYAGELALRFKNDAQKAYLAGLLHDCAKALKPDEMIEAAGDAGIEVSEYEALAPVSLLHARVGAYIAERDYGIDDAEILQAISYHQAGGIGMTVLDKIVSLADGTEPARTDEYLHKVKEILNDDLNRAYLEKYICSMVRTLQGHLFIDPAKADVYNYLVAEMTGCS